MSAYRTSHWKTSKITKHSCLQPFSKLHAYLSVFFSQAFKENGTKRRNRRSEKSQFTLVTSLLMCSVPLLKPEHKVQQRATICGSQREKSATEVTQCHFIFYSFRLFSDHLTMFAKRCFHKRVYLESIKRKKLK